MDRVRYPTSSSSRASRWWSSSLSSWYYDKCNYYPPCRLSSLFFLFLLFTLFVSPLIVLPVNGFYAFCYTITNNLSTSPYLPFAIQVSGTLNLDTADGLTQGYVETYYYYFPSSIAYGYLVTNATGTRKIYYQGNPTPHVESIINIAPVMTYFANDNIINISPPYFDNMVHGLTFIMNTSVVWATGPDINNYTYVNINNFTKPLALGAGIQEPDNPLNDQETVNITSTFSLTSTRVYSANVACPTPVSPPTIPANIRTAFNTNIIYTFCYYTQSGESPSVNYVTNVIGNITLAGYAGTTIGGRTAYLIRSLIANYSSTVTGTYTSSLVSLGGLTSAYRFGTLADITYDGAQFAQLWAILLEPFELCCGLTQPAHVTADNIFYPNFPNLVSKIYIWRNTNNIDLYHHTSIYIHISHIRPYVLV